MYTTLKAYIAASLLMVAASAAYAEDHEKSGHSAQKIDHSQSTQSEDKSNKDPVKEEKQTPKKEKKQKESKEPATPPAGESKEPAKEPAADPAPAPAAKKMIPGASSDATGLGGGRDAGPGSTSSSSSGASTSPSRDCPAGFIYSEEHGGCGPSPGLCPEGFGARPKGAGLVCAWAERAGDHPAEREVCPRGYHRSGDTCLP